MGSRGLQTPLPTCGERCLGTSPRACVPSPQFSRAPLRVASAYGLVTEPLGCLMTPKCLSAAVMSRVPVMCPAWDKGWGQPVGRGPARESGLFLEMGVGGECLLPGSGDTPVPAHLRRGSYTPGSPLGAAKPWRNRLGETPCSQAAGPGPAWAPSEPQLSAQTTCTPSCQQPAAFISTYHVSRLGAWEAVSLPKPGEWGEVVPWAVRLLGRPPSLSWGSPGKVSSMRPLPQNKPALLTQPSTLPGGDRAPQLAVCNS